MGHGQRLSPGRRRLPGPAPGDTSLPALVRRPRRGDGCTPRCNTRCKTRHTYLAPTRCRGGAGTRLWRRLSFTCRGRSLVRPAEISWEDLLIALRAAGLDLGAAGTTLGGQRRPPSTEEMAAILHVLQRGGRRCPPSRLRRWPRRAPSAALAREAGPPLLRGEGGCLADLVLSDGRPPPTLTQPYPALMTRPRSRRVRPGRRTVRDAPRALST